MILDNEHETMPREAMRALQLKRLQELVARVYDKVPYYRDKMDKAGVKPADIEKLEDIRNLPFTTKEDLRKNYPFGLFTVPMDDVVRVHASSGTTGKPTVVGYTKADIRLWAGLMARTLAAAGVTSKDMVQNAYGYGLFTGGLGAHYGAEEMGCAVIPISGGNSKRQITIMKDFGSTVLLATPSYTLNLADTMADMGIDPSELKLRVGIFGAEPWSEKMRVELESRLQIKAIDIYGLSEVLGPGVAIECIEEQKGLHIMEDHFLPEIVDRDSFDPLAIGEEGELVFTTLTKEAFPVI
ncbi:MAG: phenylacetate--CoA ligase, partial [Desulfobulbaceae bacterium]|nr:phenylacetate--CoA ligase [Desulfobulbaceae bacterium]